MRNSYVSFQDAFTFIRKCKRIVLSLTESLGLQVNEGILCVQPNRKQCTVLSISTFLLRNAKMSLLHLLLISVNLLGFFLFPSKKFGNGKENSNSSRQY